MKPKLITVENLERFKADLEATYGKSEGIAQLDENAKIPTEQIPDSAFNVDEYESKTEFPPVGEAKKIYIDRSTNNFYRWDVESAEYINTSSPEGVKYTPQELTDEQKAQARDNIGAVASVDIPDNILTYSEQELTEEEKAQARTNIDAISTEELPNNILTYSEQELTEEQKAQARENIDALSVDELPDDILTYSEQELTEEQKAQARANIDAISTEELPDNILTYSAQVLTEEQKAQARTNIDAISTEELPDNILTYSEQELTEEQQAQARANIGAASESAIPTGTVRYDAVQELSVEEKAQARSNVDAASNTEFAGVSQTVSELNHKINNFGNFVREINSVEAGLEVVYDDTSTETLPIGLDFDGGYVDEDTRYLYLKKGETVLSEDVFTPILIPGGGGGGGGSTIALTNIVKTTTVRNGASAPFEFVATASDDSGISVKWYVNEALYLTENKDSGSKFTFDAGAYLIPSDDSIVKAVINSEGGGLITRRWTVKSVAFSISWGSSINPIMLYTANDNIYVPITVSAEAGSSNVVTVRAGDAVITRNTTGSMAITVELNKNIFTTGVNVITAGMHSADDPDDKADDIHFTAIWTYQASEPIVAFANEEQEGMQYDVIGIDYFVFDPATESAVHTIQIGDGEPRTLTAGRTLQTYRYSPTEAEEVLITLACGNAEAVMTLTVHESQYDLNYYIDDSLRYDLNPVGHSNTDADREEFANLTFSPNFDWDNGGFRTDANGAAAFVVKKGNYVILPRSVFADDDANGKTIDMSFKVTNSDQYDAVAISDLNEGSTKGIVLYANNGEIRLNNVVGQMFRYCEDSRIDLSLLIENAVEQRIATVWLDGIPSKVNEYEAGMLVQNENAMYIGSEHCDVWVYAIRIYNTTLTKKQMMKNYISEGNTNEEKVKRYQTNTILNDNDKITPAALHEASPDLTIVQISAPRMTVSKKDSVPADILIQDGATILELPAASAPDAKDGALFKVQGTSSAAYGRSSYNLDLDFKGTGKKYKISEDAIGVNYINIKVNVASSENANNINAVDWYNTFQPYLTECRSKPGCRDTVQGKPCAVFFTNTNTEDVWFSSQLVRPGETVLYAMGDICNSKKNTAVFGEDNEGEHPTKACIEVSGNDTEPERFVSDQGYEYNDDEEGWVTFDGYDDKGKPKYTKHFEWRMTPSDDNKAEVIQSWENTVSWVVSTIGDSAKFKSEIGNYFAINSLLYHFLFIEYFAGYDNVSKNTFYSYDWDESARKYLWNIVKAYDMDTILAADNDGKPFGDYGLDYGDTENGRSYFNAVDNTIWVNIKEAFQAELSSLYVSLRTAGAWNSDDIANKWNRYQELRPRAAMMLDAYTKYILPYKTKDVIIDGQTLSYDDSYLPRLQGSKIYWRKQFLTYQTAYMDGKYGYYSKTNSLQFRTNCESGRKAFTVKTYAKTYITVLADDNKVASIKIGAGEEQIFENVSVGSNTTLYFTPDNLIEYIRPLNETDNSTFTASGSAKLMEAILGGDTVNNSWPAGTGVNIPSVLLKELSIRNMPNFSNSLNLSSNVELERLDTRNTNTGIIVLPTSAPLKSARLNACTGIVAQNLNKVEVFTMANGNNLVSIRVDSCNSVVNMAIRDYLLDAVNTVNAATRRIRAINIEWSFDDLNAIYSVATKWKGYNALGIEQDAPVVTGIIYVLSLSTKKLEAIHNVWGVGSFEDSYDPVTHTWTSPNLTIVGAAEIPYFTVTFLNIDNTHIKDKKGNDYYQYLDLGSEAYEPVSAGEINTPIYIDDAGQYTYTFTGWDNLEGTVNEDKTVTAKYSREIITYTVRWFNKTGGQMYDIRENVPYGSEAVYDPDGTIGFPVLEDQELAGVYKVFTGWDKSTGYIKQNTDVYATWAEGRIPSMGTTELKDMNIAQIYGIAKTDRAANYFEDEDYTEITVGHDFNFNNVESEVLLENRYFDGTSIYKTDIKLFDEDSPSFTLAIDYEFTDPTANATLVSCCDDTGSAEGFRMYYYLSDNYNENQSVKLLWGDRTDTIAHGLNRGMLVLRHQKGSRYLYVASDNNGRQVSCASAYGGDQVDKDKYVGYNLDIHAIDLRRTQETHTDAVLTFGGVPYHEYFQFPAKGWIHWCKIWYDDIGENNVKQLAIWPHETWRMHYRGHGLYNRADTGRPESASFVANAPLSQFYEFYSSGQHDTTGGWKQSLMREFVNNKCLKALPYEWQALIKPIRVVTKGGADNLTNLEYTSDKIYIPAYADLVSGATGLYGSEGTQISWFTENKYRVKFMGINISDDAQIITSADDDPSIYPSVYHVKEGDIWIDRSTNLPYVYISDDTANKHGYLAGREVKDTVNNKIAQGDDGGWWIRSTAYLARTNSSKDYQYLVFPNGNVQTGYVWSQAYLRRGIVLMFSI